MIPRIIPFAAYILFLALAEVPTWVLEFVPDLAPWLETGNLWLYPVKTVLVFCLLAYFWPHYEELRGKVFVGSKEILLAIIIGVSVYVAWVRMDWLWAIQGKLAGYDPFQAGAETGMVFAGARLLGSVMVVPVMEELFWRSFLIRYVISPRFETVRLGTFTLRSFVVTVILFGLEHQLWLAGMMAGAAYTILLYRTGRIWPCILAHATTNGALGIHVLATGEWHWW